MYICFDTPIYLHKPWIGNPLLFREVLADVLVDMINVDSFVAIAEANNLTYRGYMSQCLACGLVAYLLGC